MSIRLQVVLQRPSKGRELAFDYAPDELVIDTRIAVDQDVAERHNPREIRDGGGALGIECTNSAERLADDFKLALDCRPE